MGYILIQSKMLFIFLLISIVDSYRRKINNKYIKNNIIYFEQDEWNHGEVEWEFTENSYMNKFNISYKENVYKLLNNSNGIFEFIQKSDTSNELKYTTLRRPISKLQLYKIKNKIIIVKKEKSNNYYAFYSGLLKTFYKELLTNQSLIIFLEDLCFTLHYSNINSTFLFIILNYLLRVKYKYNKKIEIINIKKYNISELDNYLFIKKSSSLFVFTLFAIFGRNIHNAE